MASVYERTDIYDLLEDETRYDAYKKHWETVFDRRDVKTMLDVSIGSGSVTLPATDLGIHLTGSDLSESMLASCRKKTVARHLDMELKCCDFRQLDTQFHETFDCVASTGNSLPHVDNADVLKTLEQMDKLVAPGGYLYFDTRNWDKVLKDRNRFYLYNPFFDGDTRINLIQVWDYHEDDSMTFHLLYTFERENQIFQKERFEEHYFPVSKTILLDKLRQMGYVDIETRNFPAYVTNVDVENTDWYCVIGTKG